MTGQRIQFQGSHLANPIATLGLRNPANTELLYGFEIEVGWRDEANRDSFLAHMTAMGLGDRIIAKHDGSIESSYPCEIVSIPLDQKVALQTLTAVSTAIELFAAKGMLTGSCGVHFHVSKGPTKDFVIWRAVNAICATPDGSLQPVDERGRYLPEEPGLRMLNTFWDMFCLRKASKYCQRRRWRDFSQFSLPEQRHERAVISGRGTPTYEFRMFRTARSARVLVSYFEMVLALLEYCENGPIDDFVTPHPVRKKQKTEEDLAPYPDTWVADATRYGIRIIDTESGKAITTERDTATYMGRNAECMYYVHHDTLRKLGVRPPDFGAGAHARQYYNEVLMGVLTPPKAQPDPSTWTNTFPLTHFLNWVAEHAEAYPVLSKRLTLPKFKNFTAEPPADFDIAAPHLEFAPGCVVWSENALCTMKVTQIDPNPNPEQCVVHGLLVDSNTYYSDNIAYFSHLCPGAMEPGGEQ